MDAQDDMLLRDTSQMVVISCYRNMKIRRDDVYSRACQSEHYPTRQRHMVRNQVFVSGDLKIRIVFPFNQWAVYFTAMNNASVLQTVPSSLSSVYNTSAVQCLKCFKTFALDNKVKIVIFLPSSVSFPLNDAPSSTGEDVRGVLGRVERAFF